MSETIILNVKWGKETMKVEFVTAGGVKGLKTELEERTGIPYDRMKLMPKSKGLWKGVLKDDFDLSSIDFKAALAKVGGKELQVLLMGSASKLAGPKTKTVFLEDLPPEEVAKVQEPSGLQNLGNTCYLNSVVQCLRAVPELRSGLQNYSMRSNSAGGLDLRQLSNGAFLSALRETFNNLDRTVEPVPPGTLVRATKKAFPEFNRRGAQGQPMQQDAEEFYSGLLSIAAGELTGREQIEKAFNTKLTDDELKGANNLIDASFGLKMEETLTCDEFDSVQATETAEKMDVEGDNNVADTGLVEPAKVSYDLHRKLVCSIQGGSDASASANVTHIAEGVALSLNGKIEKNSEVLGRDAVWTRKQRIARLPPVIVVQFGRFYWKATPDSQDHTGVKCKVMKPVAFNGELDVYEFCTEAVQKVLKVSRDKSAREEEEKIEAKLQGKTEKDTTVEKTEAAKKNTTGGAGGEEDDELQKALAMSTEEELPAVGPGLPHNFHGIYELFAVVTHKGRDADGGHYMAWVKAEKQHTQKDKVEKISDTDEENEDWFVFDDDEVSPCKTEDVLKLKGGGDWHMSYLNCYRAKK